MILCLPVLIPNWLSLTVRENIAVGESFEESTMSRLENVFDPETVLLPVVSPNMGFQIFVRSKSLDPEFAVSFEGYSVDPTIVFSTMLNVAFREVVICDSLTKFVAEMIQIYQKLNSNENEKEYSHCKLGTEADVVLALPDTVVPMILDSVSSNRYKFSFRLSVIYQTGKYSNFSKQMLCLETLFPVRNLFSCR